ncbi:GIY-YIG nuclease family protein [Oleiharenicola sp. Vm1]|uniref:GIY-YIG nuclease family protein n=1 Tax=Oleiharenicola sp. Vm1 TaxID=3398393 RepID=UPI0039F52D97
MGYSHDLRQRLSDHNEGKNLGTAMNRPWELRSYVAFSSEKQATESERYLKSGSGHTFAKRRHW